MKQFLLPLKIFVVGHLIILCAFPFFPALDAAAQVLAAEASGIIGIFWGMSWAVASFRYLVWFFLEASVLIATGLAFIRAKDPERFRWF